MKEEFFGEEHRKYVINRPQYKLAMKLMEQVPNNGRVLEVGSGLGEFTDALVKSGYNVSCVEGVNNFVAKQKQRGLDAHQVNIEYDKLPFDDHSFDIVISLDVIEHIWNTENYLGEIYRCLNKKGYFIISTVNYNYWKYRAVHLKGKMEDYVYNSRHKKFYTLNSLPKELDSRFDIIYKAFLKNKNAVSNVIYPNLLSQLFAFLCTPK